MTRILFVAVFAITLSLSAQPASVTPIGSGCGSNFFDLQPTLDSTLPILGTTVQISGTDVPIAASGTLFSGAPGIHLLYPGNPPLVVPCYSRLDLATIVPVATMSADAAGNWSLPPLQIPTDPFFLGMSIRLQAAFPAANGSPITLSNAIDVVVGL